MNPPHPNAVPSRLYKFRALSTDDDVKFTRDIVLGHRLYFANPSSFNDPFDTQPRVTLSSDPTKLRGAYKKIVAAQSAGASRAERRRQLSGMLKVPHEVMQQTLNDSAATRSLKFGVCSLSQKCDHVLMWSHYAANHAGICLGFSTVPDSYFTFAQAVRYSHERPAVEWTSPNKEQDLFAALLTKADFWEYEQEWRLLEVERGWGAQVFPPEKLEMVIFGARITPQRKRLVSEWLLERGHPVARFQANISPEKFELTFTAV